jgi:hypothetical protein
MNCEEKELLHRKVSPLYVYLVKGTLHNKEDQMNRESHPMYYSQTH